VSGVDLETLRSDEALDALAPEWDALVRAMPRPSPFLLHGWLREWWRVYGRGAELALHVARRDGRLVGALPLCVRRHFGVRVGEFLGGRHSHLADLLLARGEELGTARALVERARDSMDVADLFGLPGGSRLVTATGGERLTVVERVEAPVLDLSRGWEAVYRDKASSRTRQTHGRKHRRLAEAGRLEVTHARTWEEIEPALEEGIRLHELRWHGRADASGLSEERGREFLRAAFRAAAGEDAARIIVLALDGKAIAFNAYLLLEGALYSYRLAFDPEYGRFSPGLLSTLEMLDTATEEGIRRVEFLGGPEDYKLQLMDGFEPLHQAVGLASGLRGRLYASLRLGSIRMRVRLRGSRPLRRLYVDGLAFARRP
jgi:CelD/BcsL family acetyltransferase involved in cellulose biosynthesis